MMPLHGFVHGDTCGVLVLVEKQATVATLAELLAQAASIRVAPASRAVVYWKHCALDPSTTLAALGLSPLDRVDLVLEVR
jgi:hypothetical protein